MSAVSRGRLTPEAKQALSATIRELRGRLLRDLSDEAERAPAFARALELAVTRIVAVKISAGMVPTPLRAIATDTIRR